MGEDHRVERVERIDLGDVEVGRPVRSAARLFPAIHQDLALRCRDEERSTTDLPAAAERCNPQPLIFARDLPVDTATDRPQERLPFVLHRPEVRADLLDRRALDGRCPDYFRRPADLFGDLPQRYAVLPDDHAGLLSLDQDLARLRVEEELGYPRALRHNGPDLLGRPFRVLKDVRAHDDALTQVTRQYSYQVRLVGELLRIVGIDDKFGSFELDI
ncbi:hypothetical protein DSECCO2_500000 [anaerobic digester metagenome]